MRRLKKCLAVKTKLCNCTYVVYELCMKRDNVSENCVYDQVVYDHICEKHICFELTPASVSIDAHIYFTT